MSDAVEQAESALRAFDEYWGDGGPVDAVYGRPFELIRALLAEVRASVVDEEPEIEWAANYPQNMGDGSGVWVTRVQDEEDARGTVEFVNRRAEQHGFPIFARVVQREVRRGPWVPAEQGEGS